MEELERHSCIRGYHVYKDKWDPVVGEVLACKRGSTNAQVRYVVAVQKNGTIVGQPATKSIESMLAVLAKKGCYYSLYSDWKETALCKKNFMYKICVFNFRTWARSSKIFLLRKFLKLRYIVACWVRNFNTE